MLNDAIDLTILTSLNCCFDTLFPQYPKEDRLKTILTARNYLQSTNKSIESLIKNPNKNSQTEKILRNSIHKYFNPIAKNTIERYFKRLEKGFIHPLNNEYLSEKISNIGERIENLSNDFFYDDKTIASVVALDEGSKSIHYRTSIHEEIIGDASDPKDEWDEKIVNIYDDEYDQNYIETIALRLKNSHTNLNFLYSWKKNLPAEAYEILRHFLKKQVSFEPAEEIEEIILPY